MSILGTAIKVGVKSAAETGEHAMVNNGVSKQFAEEAKGKKWGQIYLIFLV